MTMRNFRPLAAATLIAGWAGAASAHPGHGLQATSHWHASDSLGLLLVAGLAVAALWISRR